MLQRIGSAFLWFAPLLIIPPLWLAYHKVGLVAGIVSAMAGLILTACAMWARGKFKWEDLATAHGLASVPQFGLIAEQVEKVNPDLVFRGEDGKVSTVRYEAVNAMLLNEFLKNHHTDEDQARQLQEQQARLTKQDVIIAQQQKQIAAQQATAAQQQKQIEALTATVRKVSKRVELSVPAFQIAANED